MGGVQIVVCGNLAVIGPESYHGWRRFCVFSVFTGHGVKVGEGCFSLGLINLVFFFSFHLHAADFSL